MLVLWFVVVMKLDRYMMFVFFSVRWCRVLLLEVVSDGWIGIVLLCVFCSG